MDDKVPSASKDKMPSSTEKEPSKSEEEKSAVENEKSQKDIPSIENGKGIIEKDVPGDKVIPDAEQKIYQPKKTTKSSKFTVYS